MDGAVQEELDPQMEEAEIKKKRMYALKAHLEHEFDAVRAKKRGRPSAAAEEG